eukprot:g14243.t1
MEITILEGDGLPDGSILSIKSGTVHCQSALELGRPIYLPCTNQADLSIGLLHEICRTKLEKKQQQNKGESGSDVHDVCFQDHSGRAFSSMRLRVGQSAASSSPTKKHGHALSACKYLEKHDIAGVVRNLIAAVLKARPEKPLTWLADELDVLSKKLEANENSKGDTSGGARGEELVAPAESEKKKEEIAGEIKSDANADKGKKNGVARGMTYGGGRLNLEQKVAEMEKNEEILLAKQRSSKGCAAGSSKEKEEGGCSDEINYNDFSSKNPAHDVEVEDDSTSIPGSDFLRRAYVFRHIPQATFERHVRPMFKKHTFRQGHVFWEEGDSVTCDEHMYVVETGRVQVKRDGVLVNVIRAGGFFGERALLCDMPRQARCEAVGRGENVVWALDRDTFEDYVKNDSELNARFQAALYPSYSDAAMSDIDELEEVLSLDKYQRNLKTGEKLASDFKLQIPEEKKALFLMLHKLWVFQFLDAREMQEVLDAFTLQVVDAYMPMFYRAKTPIYPKEDKNGKIIWFQEGEPVSDNEHMYVIEQGTVHVMQNGRKINVLKHGDVMGELGMVFDLPRQCTCVVQEPTAKFWALKREDFDNLLRGNDRLSAGEHSNTFFRMYAAAPRPSFGGSADLLYGDDDSSDGDAMPIGKMMSDSEVFEQERKTLRQLLKQLWVFRHLSAEDFRSLLFRFEKEEIQCASKRYSMRMEEGGQRYCILKEGDSSFVNDFLYVIESGTVEVAQGDKILRTLGPGDLFGELAFVYDLPRQASCYAISPSLKVWKLSREAFDDLIGSSEELKTKHSSDYYKIYEKRKIADLELEESHAMVANMLKDHSWCFRYLSATDLADLVKQMERQELFLEPDLVVGPTSTTHASGGATETERANPGSPMTTTTGGDDHHKLRYVLREGDALAQDAGLYLVEQGRFEVFQSNVLVNTLTRGDVFGELGMVFGLGRQASVAMTSEHGVLWKVGYDAFEKFLSMNSEITQRPEFFRTYPKTTGRMGEDQHVRTLLELEGGLGAKDAREGVEEGVFGQSLAMGKTVSEKVSTLRLEMALRKTWVFQHMNDAERKQLAKRFERVKQKVVVDDTSGGAGGKASKTAGPKMLLLQEGDTVQESGEKNTDCLYWIESGEVRVERAGKVVTTLTDGDYFGELSLIYDTPRQATCFLVSEAATFWALHRDDFKELVAENENIVKEHAREYYRTYDNAKSDEEAANATGKEGEQEKLSPNADAAAALAAVKVETHHAKGAAVKLNLPISSSSQQLQELVYVESGQVMVFEGNQLLSMRVAGQVILEEALVDPDFLLYTDREGLRAETTADNTVLWRFSVAVSSSSGSHSASASAAAAVGDHGKNEKVNVKEEEQTGMLKVASQCTLNEIYKQVS